MRSVARSHHGVEVPFIKAKAFKAFTVVFARLGGVRKHHDLAAGGTVALEGFGCMWVSRLAIMQRAKLVDEEDAVVFGNFR